MPRSIYKPTLLEMVLNSQPQHHIMAEMCTAYRLNWYVLLCVMATLLTSTIGELTRECYGPDLVEKRGNHLCGPRLSSALSMICQHGYHWQKRSADDSMRATADSGAAPTNGWEVEPARGKSPFMDRHLAMSVLHNRGKRGIVCECCKHKCSFQELKEYCQLPGKRSYLFPLPSKPPQDQVTSKSIDDVTWGLDESKLADDDIDVQSGYLPSSLTREDLDSRTDYHIGRVLRLLLGKSSINDATN